MSKVDSISWVLTYHFVQYGRVPRITNRRVFVGNVRDKASERAAQQPCRIDVDNLLKRQDQVVTLGRFQPGVSVVPFYTQACVVDPWKLK